MMAVLLSIAIATATPAIEETYSEALLKELVDHKQIDIGFVNESPLRIKEYFVKYKSDRGGGERRQVAEVPVDDKVSLMRAGAADCGRIEEVWVIDDHGNKRVLVTDRDIGFRKNITIVLGADGKAVFVNIALKKLAK